MDSWGPRNISALQRRDHLTSSWYGQVSLQLQFATPWVEQGLGLGKGKQKMPLGGLTVFCGLALMFVFHSFLQQKMQKQKNVFESLKNCSLQNPNKLVFVRSKHPKSSGRSGGLQHMCVGYLCVHVLSGSVFVVSFCWVQRGFPRSADLPKGVKDRVLGEKSRGERGTREGLWEEDGD